MTKVGLVKGEDRFINVFQALVNAGEEVKQKIHGKVRPDVAVLDGFHSFEGEPVPQCARGKKVDLKIAVAGSDFVAVDTITAKVLGFNPQDIGYLAYSAEDGYGTWDLSEIKAVGTPIEEARRPLKPAPRIDVLLSWGK